MPKTKKIVIVVKVKKCKKDKRREPGEIRKGDLVTPKDVGMGTLTVGKAYKVKEADGNGYITIICDAGYPLSYLTEKFTKLKRI